jgi:hypothetical protein
MREIEQTIHGMDRASCAHAISVLRKRLEYVDVSLKENTATAELRPGNHVTVEARPDRDLKEWLYPETGQRDRCRQDDDRWRSTRRRA